MEREPEFSLCARTLANLFLKSGNRARARSLLGFYFKHPYATIPKPGGPTWICCGSRGLEDFIAEARRSGECGEDF